jgi:hypothetical protein
MHWRIHIAQVPFIGRKLAVGVHVPFGEHQGKLFLCEIGVDQRERNVIDVSRFDRSKGSQGTSYSAMAAFAIAAASSFSTFKMKVKRQGWCWTQEYASTFSPSPNVVIRCIALVHRAGYGLRV